MTTLSAAHNSASYHSVYHHKRTPCSRFMYHCAQADSHQHKSKKSGHEGAKSRDKDSMDVFDCSGWLHITITAGENVALVKLKHEDDHVPYWCIDVPMDVKAFVAANPNLNPTLAGLIFSCHECNSFIFIVMG